MDPYCPRQTVVFGPAADFVGEKGGPVDPYCPRQTVLWGEDFREGDQKPESKYFAGLESFGAVDERSLEKHKLTVANKAVDAAFGAAGGGADLNESTFAAHRRALRERLAERVSSGLN
ncbi:MAG: hypothetical protein AAF725_23835 [Acidobacteriota bacterium]